MNTEYTSLLPIIGPILGGCIAATAGLCVARWKWRRDGLDRFNAAIAEIEADLPDHADDLKSFHRSTLKPIRVAIYSVQPFISKRQFSGLRHVWAEYRKLDDKKLDWLRSGVEQIIATTPKDAVKGVDEMLAEYYDRFKAAAK